MPAPIEAARFEQQLLAVIGASWCDLASIERLIPHCTVEGLNAGLVTAAKRGQLNVVRLLIPMSNPKANHSRALYSAAAAGQVHVVSELIPVSDPLAADSDALRMAACNGHLDVVQALIRVCDPKADDSAALRLAAQNGHLAIVCKLIPLSDPSANESEALRVASRNGHLNIVQALLPVSDPRVNRNEALRWAAEQGQHDVVSELVSVCSCDESFRELAGALQDRHNRVDRESLLRGIDALTPHVEGSLIGRAVRDLPNEDLMRLPHLVARHQSQCLGATAPSAPAPARRRLSP